MSSDEDQKGSGTEEFVPDSLSSPAGGAANYKHEAAKMHQERVKARNRRRLGSLSVALPPPGSKPTPKVAQSALERVSKDKKARAQLIADKRVCDKVSKKSRGGKGRGEPKKGGAGGKGTWGKPGAGDLDVQSAIDKDDPNYDSESEDKVLGTEIEVKLTPEEANEIISGIISEYFQHGDTDDVADSACDLNIDGNLLYLFPKLAINLSLDRSDSERELVSVLLSDLYGYSVVIGSDLELAFFEILNELQDITVDAPTAPEMIGKFIARAVADDVLPPRFIDAQLAKFDSGAPSVALHESQGLIRMRHGLVALDNVWNSGENRRPVKYLVKKIKGMLDEYQDSLDKKNFCVSLNELGIPHFHHEVVYELVVKCLEENSSSNCSSPVASSAPVGEPGSLPTECKIINKESSSIEAFLDLLKHLTSTAIVSVTQLEGGLKRVYEDLADLAIDVPGAFISMESVMKRLQLMDILTSDVANIHQPVGDMFSPERVTVAA